MQRKISCVLFLIIIILTAGCGKKERGTSSQELDTNQLFVSYRVVSSGNNQAEVSAAFSYLHDVHWGSLADTRTVRLEGDDLLTLEVAGVTHGFNMEEIDRRVVYTALVEVGDEETDFKIMFDRPSRSEYHVSELILPAAMEITEPTENQVYSVNDSIMLNWAPVVQNQKATVCIYTNCFQNRASSVGICDTQAQETGVYITSIQELLDRYGYYALINESSCMADLKVSRSRSATVGPEYLYTRNSFASRETTRGVTINLN